MIRKLIKKIFIGGIILIYILAGVKNDIIIEYTFFFMFILISLTFSFLFYSEVFLPTKIKKEMNLVEIQRMQIDFYIFEIQNFDEIIDFSKRIYRLLKKIQMIRKFRIFAFGVTKVDLELYGDYELNWILFALKNLRSDLALRLAEQQKILEGGKSEVEKNIVGTTELESVSELQRARLDRQIEQFQELQRVLVKV